MPDSKSQFPAPIEEMLTEIRQILDEGQLRAPQSSGSHGSAGCTSRLKPATSGADAKAAPQTCGCDRTLEDVVRDLLRPMLRNWFDDNLASVIERKMRAEIARVARETAG